MAALGLSPLEAWAATPRELSLAAGWLSGKGRDAPGRADLAELMARFPDRPADSGSAALTGNCPVW